MLLLLLCVLAGLYLLRRIHQSQMRRFQECVDKVPGPVPLPIFGNALQFGLTNKSFFEYLNRTVKEYGPVYRLWIGTKSGFVLADPVSIEVVLASNKNLCKSYFYKSAEILLGQGLLLNSGEIWKRHRKIIAPTFKGQILTQFLEVFNSNSDVLMSQLLQYQDGPDFDISTLMNFFPLDIICGELWKKHRKIVAPTFQGQILSKFVDVFNANLDVLTEVLCKHQNGADFDISPYMNLFALDIICETAMGVKVNAQLHSDSDYVKGVQCLEEIVVMRGAAPWLHPNAVYRLSPLGHRQKKYLPVILDMTKRVINERGKMRSASTEVTHGHKEQEEDTGARKTRAFLDYLMDNTGKGSQLSNQEIQDEVNNILFAGHDTTACSISYTCWLLAHHPDIQEKTFAELRTIFGDSLRHCTLQDLGEMNYLEQVIKESLRILPPVPFFARKLSEDIKSEKYIFPAGCEVGVNVYMLHRHPDYFPDPEKFDPDRFRPENCVGRHPYCYLPFSGGPRMCLGYKYAILEMKSAMAHILRHFKILPPQNPFQDLDLSYKIVMKSSNGVRVRLETRSTQPHLPRAVENNSN